MKETKHRGWTTVLAMSLLSLAIPAYSQAGDTDDGRNWELSFGVEGMSFHSANEGGMGLSNNPFEPYRTNMSATATFGKWITPEIGIRAKGTGYWGVTMVSDKTYLNASRFYSVQEHVMLNALNLIQGHDNKRLFNAIPYGGVGFARNCSHNRNAFCIVGGVNNTLRLSNHLKVHLDISTTLALAKNKPVQPEMGRYNWLAADFGLTFNLGKLRMGRWFNSRAIYNNGVRNYRTIRYSNHETDTLARTLAKDDTPEGMVLINRGHIRMGTENIDTLWGMATPMRDISVDDFWMDRTEVTNAMYRAFINDVVDSIIAERMKDPYYMENRQRVMESLYVKNPITGERTLDGKQLIYVYEVYDYVGAAMRQNRLDPKERILNTDIEVDPDEVVMISKDTAYIDMKGNIVRETITRPLSSPYDFLNTYVVNICPDSTVWVNDFPKSDNSMYMRYYLSHKDYDDYPVVGVTWEQANAYCAWRTEQLKNRMGGSLGEQQPFRLPTEAEWEYAARGKTQNEFPWEQAMSGEGRQLMFANFQPDDGDYTKDGNIITAKVGTYPANTNGLYDMAGNVAEWTSTAYTDAGIEGMNNINPQHSYNASSSDPYRKKKKTVKGGSWKDSESHIKSAWRTSEYQNQPRSYIGFRCVRSIATKPTEKTIIIK